jgi:hypothetical protein
VEIGGKQLKHSATRCADPNIEIGDFLKPGHTVFGCSLGAPVRNGNQYKIAEKCTCMMNGHKNIALTVQGDGAYIETTDEALGKMQDRTATVASAIANHRNRGRRSGCRRAAAEFSNKSPAARAGLSVSLRIKPSVDDLHDFS